MKGFDGTRNRLNQIAKSDQTMPSASAKALEGLAKNKNWERTASKPTPASESPFGTASPWNVETNKKYKVKKVWNILI